MASKYLINNPQGVYFLTYTIVQWIDVFTRSIYKDILIDSIKHSQQQKGLMLHAYCIMSNHVHMIASASEGYQLSAIVRDQKKFTAKRIYETIQQQGESRRNWMSWLFRSAGSNNVNNKYIQVWQQDNHPIELATNEMIDQRLDYIHNNPVKAGIVADPVHYIYSSALNYAGGKGLVDIVLLD